MEERERTRNPQRIKLEMADSLMKGMASLFEENYVQLPEEKTNVLEEMAEKLDEMEE